MVSSISQQTAAPTTQTGTDALLRNEQSSQTSSDTPASTSTPTPKLDASYNLDLSDAALTKLATSSTETNSPENAKKLLDQIKSSLQNSTTNLNSLHKTSPQSVMDLLA